MKCRLVSCSVLQERVYPYTSFCQCNGGRMSQMCLLEIEGDLQKFVYHPASFIQAGKSGGVHSLQREYLLAVLREYSRGERKEKERREEGGISNQHPYDNAQLTGACQSSWSRDTCGVVFSTSSSFSSRLSSQGFGHSPYLSVYHSLDEGGRKRRRRE